MEKEIEAVDIYLETSFDNPFVIIQTTKQIIIVLANSAMKNQGPVSVCSPSISSI